MDMTIHCPKCRSPLTAPTEGVGCAARCPQCKTVFRVPDFDDVLADSVAGWLEVPDEEDDDDLQAGPAQTEEKPQAPATDPPAQAVPAAPVPPTGGKKSSDAADKRPRLGSRLTQGTKNVYEVKSAVGPGSVEPREASPKRPVRQRKTETAAKPTPTSPVKTTEPQVPETTTSDVRLDVRDVSAAGVLLGFHAGLLQRVAFRASLPQRCMVCGERDPKKLIARPVVWIDKAHGKYLSAGETEQLYEVHLHGHQTARSLVQSMRAIEELPPPLNNPIPYYVCPGCSSKCSVRGEAMATAGGVACEVLIPVPEYALEWLGRVNGVCGSDYEKLEETAGRLEDETWSDIPEKIRGRLSAWFDFVGAERFLEYFADTDFTRADAGLAGLVVTTDRLVYCKYHHHGSIRLDDGTEQLKFREDGAFFDVSRVHDGHLQKMVRLRRADVESLEQLLDDLPFRFKVEFVDAED